MASWYQDRAGQVPLIVVDGRDAIVDRDAVAVPGNQDGVIGQSRHCPVAQYP